MEQNQPPGEPAPTFEDLYAEHAGRVLRLLRLFGVMTDQDREDASQEVWLAVHRGLSRFDPRKGTARAWVAGIARNTSRDFRRAERRRPEPSAHAAREPVTMRTAELEAAEAERREALLSYFERAVPNEDQRVAFELHVIEGMTAEEVAETTAAPVSTVKWRIAMARRRLQEEMTEEERRKLLAILPVMSVDAFVRAMRETKFPEGEIARVWERVSAQIEAEGGSVHDRLGGPQISPAPNVAVPKAYMFTGPGLASAFAGAFLLGAVAGAAALYAFLSPERRPSMTAITADIPLPPVVTGKPQPEPLPTASAAPKRTNALVPAPPSWTSEAWLLDRARRAEAAEALALADQHAQRFPESRRAAAREEIAVHALVRLGRRAEAEARAARLLQRAPQKRQAIESLLGEKLL